MYARVYCIISFLAASERQAHHGGHRPWACDHGADGGAGMEAFRLRTPAGAAGAAKSPGVLLLSSDSLLGDPQGRTGGGKGHPVPALQAYPHPGELSHGPENGFREISSCQFHHPDPGHHHRPGGGGQAHCSLSG